MKIRAVRKALHWIEIENIWFEQGFFLELAIRLQYTLNVQCYINLLCTTSNNRIMHKILHETRKRFKFESIYIC